MASALALAKRGLGRVWPNPAVGCVLTHDGQVVGRGWTQPGGRPHAETEALRRAGTNARGATAYVTLEPCDHFGKTPPCSVALVEAGIARAVVAVVDPDPRVAGKGLERLRAAGVAVETGPGQALASEINAGFFLRVTKGRPLFTLKVASTLDGRIATHTGDSQWITGPEARAIGHRARATHDAILIGIGTALADDALLTCRLPGLEERSPLRIVMDSRLRLPLDGRLVTTAARVPTWIVTVEDHDLHRRRALEDAGARVIAVAADASGRRPDPGAMARELGGLGLTRVLVEGGGHVAAALLRAGLIDRLAWHRGPSIIGGDGLAALASLGVDVLSDAPRYTRAAVREAGADILETYRRDS